MNWAPGRKRQPAPTITKSANFDVQRSIAVNLYLRAFKEAIVRFDDKKGWQRSSLIALSMMFALFPFCIFVLALAGVSSSGLDSQKVINLVFGAWPDVFAAPIVKELSAVLHQSDGKTLTFSGLMAVIFVYGAKFNGRLTELNAKAQTA